MQFALSLLLVSLAAFAHAGEEVLVFEDNFDSLDESKWQHMVTGWRGGNHEFQYYRNDRNNSFVRDGVLYIQPTFTADTYGEDFVYNGALDLWAEGCIDEWNIDGGCYIYAHDEYIVNPVQSARMRTSTSFSFTYGRVEVRAQVPKGDWLWPAIWMLPQHYVYGGWPLSGEMDIMESKGNLDLRCWEGQHLEGHQKALSTMHWGPAADQNAYYLTSWSMTDETHPFGDDFHLYEMEWFDYGVRFSIDGHEIGAVYPPEGGFWELGGFNGHNIWEHGTKMAPFDQDFHILLNVAVGGNFFPDGCNNAHGEKPWYGMNVPGAMKSFWEAKETWFPTWNTALDASAMKIDYIRVYQQQ